VAAVIVAAVVAISGIHKPAPHSGFVTSLQAGEFRSVPSACGSVSPALLGQYLPGKARKVTPAGTSGTTSQCSFTVDTKQQLARPGKKAPLPAAQITPLPGLGKQAFSALQVVHAGRSVTDLVTVLARDRNLVITVSLQAQASGDGFGPVSVTTLRAGALAVSRAVMARGAAEPAVRG
jgi:hypothetical protein